MQSVLSIVHERCNGEDMADCKKCDNHLESFQLDETPKLMVRGKEIGIAALDEIMREAREAGWSGEVLAQQLLEKVKERDYVPPSLQNEYRAALVLEYHRRYG